MAEDTSSGTYPIADEPPSEEMPREEKPAAPSKAVVPLPRMWKTEPEDDGEDPETPAKAKPVEPPSRPKPKSTKSRNEKPAGGGKDGKRVLVEETPAFDTIESRRRARLMVGGSIVVVIVMMVWITYRVFLYDPGPIVVQDDPGATQGSPEIPPSLDQEARFMYNRAHELAKKDQTAQAVEMLTRIVKAYKGTPTAADAATALARPKSNLPLFLEGPSVVASPGAIEPSKAETAPPPAIVSVTPEQAAAKQGSAALVLPANPSEKVMTSSANPALAPVVAARPLPAGFKADLNQGVDESGWPKLIIGDRDGAPMVLVPGGTVPMGGDDSPAETPVVSARVSTFYVDQHEVSNRQFRAFLIEARYKGNPPGKWLTDESRDDHENLPVVRVNANDAKSFADWAGKQLPTEAQWELAARSFDGRPHPWGNDPAKWSRPRAFRQIDPVMTFTQDLSPYGAYDMAGNALEWTKDWYDPKYYRVMANRTLDNPTGPSTRPRSGQLVVKGCSKTFHLGARDGVAYDKRLPYLGFRCVLAVESSPLLAPGAPPGQPGTPAALPGKAAPPPVPF